MTSTTAAAYLDSITIGCLCSQITLYADASMRAVEEGYTGYGPEPSYVDEAKAMETEVQALRAERRIPEAWFFGDKLYFRDGKRKTWYRGSAIWQAGGDLADEFVQHLAAEFAAGRRTNHPNRSLERATRFDIRRKTYPFSAAPDLTGTEASYVPAILVDGELRKSPLRYKRALDAAIEAARMDHERTDQGPRGAYVGCEHGGERPKGAMKGFQYVSYRPRA